jgi:sporulation protein YlmC with PRC-barrel domain
MNAIRISLLFAALCLASAPAAQAQQPPPNPTPATSETEGTAADRTPPNPSATRPIEPGQTQVDPQTDPRPSTNPAEGTAADRTPPGRTSTTSGATAQLVGAAVVTPSGAPIGKVVDVVFDSVAQQPAFVVIASENGQAAVPYSVASSMKSGGKVVIDKSRLKSAPKVKDGEWRNETGSHWQQESARYWEQSGG